MIKHGYLEPTEEDESIIFAHNVVDFLRRFGDGQRRDAFYQQFAEMDLTRELERLLDR